MARKILMLTPYYTPGVGGACRMMEEIVTFLKRQGHDVDVLTYGSPLYQDCDKFDQLQDYPVYRVAANHQTGKTILEMGRKLLKISLASRYDIIFSGVAYPCAILSFLIKKLLRIPYVVYTHGEDTSIVKGSEWKSVWLKHSMRSAKAVMANSHYSSQEVVALGVPKEHIQLANPGINPVPFMHVDTESVNALRRHLGLVGKRIILTVARLDARKGHDTIIRSLPHLRPEIPNVHYVIVGRGDSAQLIHLAKSLEVAEAVTIITDVSDQDLPLYYSLCDVYAMVSRYDSNSGETEGFGIVYLEAAASGKPCVAGAAGGATDAVSDGETGLIVSPESLDQIISALSSLLSNAHISMRLGEAGRKRVVAEFDANILLTKIETLLCA